jgi:bifunctional UDP-N-acetylglucosamine pyrophosphorylase/glucosamine-1-phosphate N-acetyltransferase
MSMALTVVILAAGQGKRMRSKRPKVLQPLAGRPLLSHVLDTARALDPAAIAVVVGHGGEDVREACAAPGVTWVEQSEQLGTGHAVMQAMPGIPHEHQVLVLCGDVPLVRSDTLQQLMDQTGSEELGVLTARVADPTGYGRILRDDQGLVRRIVEQVDATAEEQAVDEINSGLMVLPAGRLRGWLNRLGNDNAQGEYYLTDVISMACEEGLAVQGVQADADEILGINDKAQLAHVERLFQRRQSDALMAAGVTLADPERIDIRGTLRCGSDVFIDVGVVFEGQVELGDGVHIGAQTVLRNVSLGAGTIVHPFTLMDEVQAGRGCEIGPFTRLRPGAEFADQVKVGNFVEIKKSRIGSGSKVSHLSYVGDATIGRKVNVGAGTITCNYDGANKHQTIIEDEAFIGSGVELVAPVRIGRGATVGAGSTISHEAPDGKLTLERARQRTLEGWQRPKKGR